MTTTTPTSIKLQPEEYDLLRKASQQNFRSISSEVRFRVLNWEQQFERAEKAERMLKEVLLGRQPQQLS